MWGIIILITVIAFFVIIGTLVGTAVYQQTRNYSQNGCIQVRDIPVTEWLNNQVTIHKDWLSGYWVCRN
jgi:predicted PurR-regulated permease PerM